MLLQQIVISDISVVFKGLSNSKITKYYGVHFDTLEATQEQMNWYAALEENGTGIWWAIRTSAQGYFVGAIGFNDVDMALKKAEIGFWLLPDFWGKGILKEAILSVTSYAFKILKLQKLEAFVETENRNCIKALEKLNFNLDTTLLKCKSKNNTLISLYVYSINSQTYRCN
ncbi:MAG: GNAT family N-acetyltransferase [Flavicella sp.]